MQSLRRASQMFATSEKRLWAGLWRGISGLVGASAKVKAHLTREEAIARGQGHFWARNDRAGRLANVLADTLLPATEVRDEIDALLEARCLYLRAAVRRLGQ